MGVDLDDIYYTLLQNGFKKKEINSVLNNYKPKKKLDDSLLDKGHGKLHAYQYRISEEDSHPNSDGNKLIYGVLYDEYKKIYS